MPLEICVIFAILTKCPLVLTTGTGQKAHFSLQDTPGSFTVHANKMLAKVSSKPDSIKVIVKPGMAEFPVPQLPTQKPLVHVVSPAIVKPIGGWNFMSFGKKRSRIESSLSKGFGKDGNYKHFERNVIHSSHSTVSKSIVKQDKLGKKRSRTEKRSSLRKVDKADRNHFGRNLFKRLERKNTVIKSLIKPGKENRQTKFEKIDSKINIVKTFGEVHSNSRKSKHFNGGNRHVKPGEKRGLVERKMQVKGETGKFSVHVDKKLANVSSSTGGVEVFIKNPSPKQMSQLPREMLQLPGTMVQLPNGMSQLYNGMSQLPHPVSQFTKGISQLPKEKPWVLVRLPYDWTGASNWDDDDN